MERVDDVLPNAAENYTAVTLQRSTAQLAAALVRAARQVIRQFLNLDTFGVSADSKMAVQVSGLLTDFSQKLSASMSPLELAGLFAEILPPLREQHTTAVQAGYTRLEPWVGELVNSLESIDARLGGGAGGTALLAARSFASTNGKNGSSLAGLGRLVQPLLQPPSVQPRNTLRLARDVKALYSTQADTLPRFLTTFKPGLKGVLYRAWAGATITPDAPLQSVNAFRVRAAPFGNNAPPQLDSDGKPLKGVEAEWPLNEPNANILYLDAQYDHIKPESWVIIERPKPVVIELMAANIAAASSDYETVFRKVLEVRTVSRLDYGMNGKVTRLTLDDEWCQAAVENGETTSFLRNVTVFAQSEDLPRAEQPVTEDVYGSTLELAELYDGLESGRWVIVSGERTDIPGTSAVQASELVMLAGVTQGVAQVDTGDGVIKDLPEDKIHTTLQFANELAYTYKRDTVTVYGNVVKATHGETRQEVLGSGDASQVLQAFTLKQSPLTFTSAPTPSGIESTLLVRVNDVRWPQADGLLWLDPNQRGYITKTDDDAKTSVIFGDGEHGARLPTGQENIKATYRFGIGKPGNVDSGRISLLATRPLGVKSVINPLPATGGADREDRDQARANAPLAVMALDRLVSVQDYADFARTFAGVGKASAVRLSDGRRELVHVTIAGADDIPISETSDLYQNLKLAFQQYNGDPFQPVQLAVRNLKLLVAVAKVRLLADYEWESVEPQLRAAMLDTFSFAKRNLGQDVVSSQVISTLQSVPGVSYVDLDVLDAVSEDANLSDLANLANTLALHDRIPVYLARLDPANVSALPRPILPAQLAYLSPEIPDTLILTELTS
jgi:predicted phage baseplate assembly protein